MASLKSLLSCCDKQHFFHMSSLPLNVTGRLTSSGRQEEGISWDVQDFPDNSNILERGGRGDVRGVERTEFSL